MLNTVSYFEAQRVHDFVEETQFEVVDFPCGSTDLTSVEE